MGIFCLLALCWVLGGWLWQILVQLSTTAILSAVVLWNSWTQVVLAFTAGWFGEHSLKITYWIWGLHSSGRMGWGFLSDCMVLCQWWDLWSECFSAFSTCLCFISHPVYRNHSTLLWIALRGSFSMYSCIFGVSVGEGEFRRLLCHHLVLESKYSFVLSCLKWFLVHHFWVRISHGMYKTLELFFFL